MIGSIFRIIAGVALILMGCFYLFIAANIALWELLHLRCSMKTGFPLGIGILLIAFGIHQCIRGSIDLGELRIALK